MTDFLASVTSVQEAATVLERGADIIDLKNPAQGALGALRGEKVRAIVHFVASRRLVSATIGDLPMQPDVLSEAVVRMAACGVDIVKVGFFGQTGHEECVQALASLASLIKLVAVLFADQAPSPELPGHLAAAGFHGVMLDTANKTQGSLCAWMQPAALRSFVQTSKAAGLRVGLAGALRCSDIPRLCLLEPDYLGFRSALCFDDRRMSAVDPQRVISIKKVLQECNKNLREKTVLLQC
ncbi:MAG: (5-formylfuran-3-yl)methyl phosphate synthase [Methylophilaceae bacterium]|nr:(5-formylfuran-3-yl)methyl phosphate synthase [Methylophilaceae bacterium]